MNNHSFVVDKSRADVRTYENQIRSAPMSRSLTRSNLHHRKALSRLPLGVSSNFRYWGEESTIYIERGEGCRLWDIETGRVLHDFAAATNRTPSSIDELTAD